jgi:hypothetical protein
MYKLLCFHESIAFLSRHIFFQDLMSFRNRKIFSKCQLFKGYWTQGLLGPFPHSRYTLIKIASLAHSLRRLSIDLYALSLAYDFCMSFKTRMTHLCWWYLTESREKYRFILAISDQNLLSMIWVYQGCKMKNSIFSPLTPCTLMEIYWGFWITYCLYPQGSRYIPKDRRQCFHRWHQTRL